MEGEGGRQSWAGNRDKGGRWGGRGDKEGDIV